MRWPIRFANLRIVTLWSFGALLVLLAAGFALFYSAQSRYFSERNFRVLSTIGSQIDESTDSHARLLRSLLSRDDFFQASQSDDALKTWLDKVPPDLSRVLSSTVFPRSVAAKFSPTAAPIVRLLLAGPEPDVEFGYQSQRGTATKKAKNLLQPILSQKRYAGAFDALVLATSTGRVLLEADSPNTQLRVRELSALIRSTPAADAEAAFRKLSNSTNLIDVETNGVTYRLFIQPCCRSLQVQLPAKPKSEGPGQEPSLVVAGLIATSRFRSEAMAVSFSFVVMIGVVLLLGVIGSPFLKLAMSGDTDRVTSAHVLWISMSCIGGLALLTVALLDWHAYGRLNRTIDDQLEHLAIELKTQLNKEVAAGYTELLCLSEDVARQNLPKPTPSYKGCRKAYPQYDAFSLLDRSGMQVVKVSPNEWVAGFVSAAQRPYFQAALRGTVWPLKPLKASTPSTPSTQTVRGAYVESVRSSTSGQLRAIIAAPTDGAHPVATISIPLKTAIDTVIMPGFAFAVIEPSGKVLFHSDTERNLSEDLFVETDSNRRLRAAVAARQSKALTAHYWGQSHRLYVTPLEGGTPWSIVALYDQRSAWALQEEWVVVALGFLAVYMFGFAVLLAALVLGHRSRHASWIWPQPSRLTSYWVLACLHMFLVGLFIALINARSGSSLAITGLLVPALVCLLTFALLQRSTRRPQDSNAVIPIYSVVGTLVLVLVAVLPAVAFFKVAHDLPTENYVKHRQLRLAQSLVATDRLAPAVNQKPADSTAGGDDAPPVLARAIPAQQPWLPDARETGVYYQFFFNTTPIKDGSETGGVAGANPHAVSVIDPVPELLKEWLPYQSEESVEMRELSEDGTPSHPWHWDRSETADGFSALTLNFGQDRGISFSSVPLRLFPPDPAGYMHPTSGKVEPQSSPGLAEVISVPDEFGADAWLGVQAALIALGLIAACAAAVRFICRRIFLVRLEGPAWGFSPDLVAGGENMILVGGALPAGMNCHVVDFGRLGRSTGPAGDLNAAPRDAWKDELNTIDDTDAPQIAITNVDIRVYDPELAEKKLEFIEQVVLRQNRPVILTSRKSTKDIAEAVPRLRERWETLFSSFAVGDSSEQGRASSGSTETGEPRWMTSLRSCLRQLGEAARRPFQAGAWKAVREAIGHVALSPAERLDAILEAESKADEVVRRICDNIKKELGSSVGLRSHLTSEDLLDQIGRRASTHYRRIWIGCTKTEKLVLAHIAEDGLVNAKSRRTVRGLIGKGLIRACPDFRLMNTTFERFVLSGAQQTERIVFESNREASLWDRLQWPITALMVTALLFFLVTQKAMFDSTIASLGAAAAAVPAFVRALGLVKDRPLLASTKPPDSQVQA